MLIESFSELSKTLWDYFKNYSPIIHFLIADGFDTDVPLCD